MENNELVLKVEPLKQMQNIVFNYEEIKKGLGLKLQDYKGMMYTDDTINLAKEDKAKLNKLKKALSDERIRIKKLYNQPVEEFELKIKELVDMIDEPIEEIDVQIKKYEDEEKEQKKNEIVELYNSKEISKEVQLGQIWNERWMNKTVSMNKVAEELDAFVETYKKDTETIKNLKSEDEVILLDHYKKGLDLNEALAKKVQLEQEREMKAEQERLRAERERIRAEQEALKAEEIKEEAVEVKSEEESYYTTEETSDYTEIPEEVEEQIFTLKFSVKGTKQQLMELARYLKANNLTYEQI